MINNSPVFSRPTNTTAMTSTAASAEARYTLGIAERMALEGCLVS